MAEREKGLATSAVMHGSVPCAEGQHAGAPSRGSGEQEDLAAGAPRLEITVGVGRGGEGIASVDVGFEDAVTQRGEHVARHRVQIFRGVVKEHRLGEGSRPVSYTHLTLPTIYSV